MNLGRILITFGILLVVVGTLIELAPWIPLGRLPGDIRITTGGARIYIPIVSSILVSVVLSLVFALLARR